MMSEDDKQSEQKIFISDRCRNTVESYIKFAIEIEDSGVGISKENLKNMFIDFGKLSEHSKINPTGTGLGLSICKLIVEKMNGKIHVESEPNVGTTFQVIIRTKVLLNQEPEFLRKYSIQRKESDDSMNMSLKRVGGFLRISSKNLLLNDSIVLSNNQQD